jgi:hypothetical protein
MMLKLSQLSHAYYPQDVEISAKFVEHEVSVKIITIAYRVSDLIANLVAISVKGSYSVQ